MNQRVSWAIAALLILLCVAGLIFEASGPTRPGTWALVIAYSLLCVFAAIGLVRRINAARHLASILLLLTALPGMFDWVLLVVAAYSTTPIDYALVFKAFVHGAVLGCVVASIWWLTS